MDHFVQSVGTGGGTTPFGTPCNANTVMDYYDGNTVTALWNYAQHYAMSDNSYGTTFGPSAPGRDQPGLRRHRQRRHDARGQQPVDLDVDQPRRRPDRRTARAATR